MKYCLVIPTYSGHMAQVEMLLKSFSVNCLDKDKISIRLIISENEKNVFENLISKYVDLDLECISLSKIIKEISGEDVNDVTLLNNLGKFNFQSLKKLYGVRYYNSELSLVTDSESLLIKSCNFSDVFESFNKNKYVIFSKASDTYMNDNGLQRDIIKNNFNIIGATPKNMWFLDSQYWFYKKEIVEDFFNYIKDRHGSVLNVHQGMPTFDYVLYASFVYENNDKYNHTFLDMNKIILEKFGNDVDYDNYIKNLKVGSAFEYFPWHLNENNYNIFKDIYKEYDLKFFKYDDRNFNDKNNVNLQRKFILNDVIFLTCRVSCETFEINNFKIIKNH